MRAFAPYAAQLKHLLDGALLGRQGPTRTTLMHALDGQPSAELRRLVPLEELRRSGAFFTGSRLARRLARRVQNSLRADSVILDPACGAGDLLIACAAHLPLKRDLQQTLDVWSRCLRGRDIHEEFVRAARLRLALAGLSRGVKAAGDVGGDPSQRLVGIQRGSGLEDQAAIAAATHVVMNPPFVRVAAPKDCTWGSGSVSAAGLFLEACVKAGRPGTRVVAILPDVLRSGARYEKWRRMILDHADVRAVTLLGQFERWADVDVFLLDLEVVAPPHSPRRAAWVPAADSDSERLDDHFDICVGPVVDYRDPRQGTRHPFITARDVPAWATQRYFPTSRSYGGRVIRPPFVVVRRTSRRGDRSRAIATIIRGGKPVAVENHLLVLVPKDRTIARCEQALKVLRAATTSRWLDQRIRCRHLTVGALAGVPWQAR